MDRLKTALILGLGSVLGIGGTYAYQSFPLTADLSLQKTYSDGRGQNEASAKTGDKTLNCGASNILRDEKSGEPHDFAYNLALEIGRQVGYEIIANENLRAPHLADGLGAGKNHFGCVLYVRSPWRLKEVDFTDGIVGLPVFLYVRVDDNRYDDLNKANNAGTKLVYLEKDISSVALEASFPKAKAVKVDSKLSVDGAFDAVVQKKADAVLQTKDNFDEYDKNHPHSLKQVGVKPAYVAELAFPVPKGDVVYKAILNAGLSQLKKNGRFEELLKKYTEQTDAYIILDDAH
jgi:ABC-type amino acid transport substrate-binding protein